MGNTQEGIRLSRLIESLPGWLSIFFWLAAVAKWKAEVSSWGSAASREVVVSSWKAGSSYWYYPVLFSFTLLLAAAFFCSCGNVFVSWCIGFCSACNVFGVPWSSGSPGSQGAHINTMRFSFYMLYRLVGSLCIVCLATVSALFSCCVGYSGFCHDLGCQGSSAPKAPRSYDQYHPLLFFELLCRVFL